MNKIYDFKCNECGNIEERYIHNSVQVTTQKCKCGGWMSKLISSPGMVKTNFADKTGFKNR